jgi:hypothetical protein
MDLDLAAKNEAIPDQQVGAIPTTVPHWQPDRKSLERRRP